MVYLLYFITIDFEARDLASSEQWTLGGIMKTKLKYLYF